MGTAVWEPERTPCNFKRTDGEAPRGVGASQMYATIGGEGHLSSAAESFWLLSYKWEAESAEMGRPSQTTFTVPNSSVVDRTCTLDLVHHCTRRDSTRPNSTRLGTSSTWPTRPNPSPSSRRTRM